MAWHRTWFVPNNAMLVVTGDIDPARLRADLDYRVNLKNELLLSEVLRRLESLESRRNRQPNAEFEFGPED